MTPFKPDALTIAEQGAASHRRRAAVRRRPGEECAGEVTLLANKTWKASHDPDFIAKMRRVGSIRWSAGRWAGSFIQSAACSLVSGEAVPDPGSTSPFISTPT